MHEYWARAPSHFMAHYADSSYLQALIAQDQAYKVSHPLCPSRQKHVHRLLLIGPTFISTYWACLHYPGSTAPLQVSTGPPDGNCQTRFRLMLFSFCEPWRHRRVRRNSRRNTDTTERDRTTDPIATNNRSLLSQLIMAQMIKSRSSNHPHQVCAARSLFYGKNVTKIPVLLAIAYPSMTPVHLVF